MTLIEFIDEDTGICTSCGADDKGYICDSCEDLVCGCQGECRFCFPTAPLLPLSAAELAKRQNLDGPLRSVK